VGQRTCGAEEARTRLPELLERARDGRATLITRRGRVCAAIVPAREAHSASGSLSILDLRGSGRGLWKRGGAAAVRALRDEWR
jgi:prevent-host-death family protein